MFKCKICNEPEKSCTKNCKSYYFYKPLSTQVQRLYNLAESQLDDQDPSLLNASLHVHAISNSNIVLTILEYVFHGGYRGKQDHVRKHYEKLASEKLKFITNLKGATVHGMYLSCEICGRDAYLIITYKWNNEKIEIYAKNVFQSGNKILVDCLAFEDFWDHILDFQDKLYLYHKITTAVRGCRIMPNIGYRFLKSLSYGIETYQIFLEKHKTNLYANVLEKY